MKRTSGDRCPCGSGNGYRDCCQPQDLRAGYDGPLSPDVRAAAKRAPHWEVDIVPVPATLDDDPAARPGVAVVAIHDVILDTNALTRPPTDPAAIARVLAELLREARRRVGALPPEVRVRDEPVAELLRRQLEDPAPRVAAHGRLPLLERAAKAMRAALLGPEAPVYSMPETWAGWDLGPERVAQLFSAAAAFYRQAPWNALTALQRVTATLPGGRRCLIVVGGVGGEPSLGLFFGPRLPGDPAGAEEDSDEALEALLAELAAASDDPMMGLEGRLIVLRFVQRAELSRKMQKEVAKAGWEVAAPDAYPSLVAMNTPAGGLPIEDADALIAALQAVPRFIRAERCRLADLQEVRWRDERTGLELDHAPWFS